MAPEFRTAHARPEEHLARGRDRRIYFAPGGSIFDYSFPSEDGGADGEIASYLVACDPDSRQRVDYGPLVEKTTGRKVLGTHGATCGPDGTLYFFGAVDEPDPKKALPVKVLDKVPFILKLIIVDPKSLGSAKWMKDGTKMAKSISPSTRRVATVLAAGTLCVLGAASGLAQPRRAPLVPLYRLEFRELGYRFFNEIPGDAAFITALAMGRDVRIYGATSGVQSYLFAFSAETNQVKPLGTVADAQGVHHSLAVGRDGVVYVGTGKNVLQRLTIKPDLSAGFNHISEDLWTQVKDHYAGYAGGRIYRYDPSKEPRMAPPGQAAALTDFGAPVPGDGNYCMTIDPERQVLYGITDPRANFFLYDLRAGRAIDKGPMFKDVLFGGPDDRTLQTLPRDLAVAASGDVYTSTDGGRILRFDPVKQEFQTLAAAIPGEAMQVVEAWARDGDVLYGGTSEGFVFRFSPASGEGENLGKPMLSQRIRGLVLGKNRMLYGLAGDRRVPNLLFSYDLNHHRFESLGGVEVDRSPFYSWRAHQFDAMATGLDGTIFMGESDRGGHLFFYIP